MFGYITVNRPELKIKDDVLYRSFYCGLCRSLKKRHGPGGQATLSYDMTFVALLLSALYEPETEDGTSFCLIHPAERHPIVKNEYIDYAADMNLLLAYYNLQDDWQDDKKLSARLGADLLKGSLKKVEAAYPRQTKAVQDYLAAVAEIEKKGQPDLDGPAGATGIMLGELLVKEEDVWSETLRQLGFFLGKFIYLMDAYEDLEKDLNLLHLRVHTIEHLYCVNLNQFRQQLFLKFVQIQVFMVVLVRLVILKKIIAYQFVQQLTEMFIQMMVVQ